MKKLLTITTLATLLLGGIALTASEHGERDERKFDSRGYAKSASVANNPVYDKECGACHMPYQAEFLPKRSWKKMMATLENHFGTDATLEPEDDKVIFGHLMDNASDSKRTGRQFEKISDYISKDETPLRISGTRYFIKEHREIPQKYIDQKEVKSIANCTACHTKAREGDYREHNIFIPNYGRWDD